MMGKGVENVKADMFDSWLIDDMLLDMSGGDPAHADEDIPAAMVMVEHLKPVALEEGILPVVFPPTYARDKNNKKEDEVGGKSQYIIDEITEEIVERGGDSRETRKTVKRSVCVLDTPAAQANRMEPIFKRPRYKDLVPQILVKVPAGQDAPEHLKDGVMVNLLDAGHRAADGVIRFAEGLGRKISDAFREYHAGNSEPLARIAPTSLVFGAWDSRKTNAKVPRLVTSTITAWDVSQRRRGAQYKPPVSYYDLGTLEKDYFTERVGEDKTRIDSMLGLAENPSVDLGGVTVRGPILREAVLNLTALRVHGVPAPGGGLDYDGTLKLRRYLLGLALVALTSRMDHYLRQGCHLVRKGEASWRLVRPTGFEEPVTVEHGRALEYACLVARDFGVGQGGLYYFSADLAKKDAEEVKNQNRKNNKPSKKGQK